MHESQKKQSESKPKYLQAVRTATDPIVEIEHQLLDSMSKYIHCVRKIGRKANRRHHREVKREKNRI